MIDISDIPALLRRRALWLYLGPIVLIVLAFAYISLKTPVYRTSAQLLVQPGGIQLIADEPRGPVNNQTFQGMDLDSQTYVILSEAVLNQVASRLALDETPSFRTAGLRARMFGSATAGTRSSLETRAQTILALRDAVQVSRLDRSFVFLIRVSHPDPLLAAEIANETAIAYIDQTRDSRVEALVRASSALGTQAQELRRSVEQAEAAVEQYRARKGLITTAGGLVLDQQLEDLSAQITDARVEAERAKAAEENISRLTVADVEAGAIPQAASNSVLSSLRMQYATIARDVAEAATTLGANHPTLRELQSQQTNTQRQIEAELQRIKRTVRGQYEQAASTLQALESQSGSMQSQNSVQGQALIELRQLQSEAEASRAVYEAFLKRSRELEELPQLQTNTSRILSEAPIPAAPSGPSAGVVLAAAGFFGLVLSASTIVGLAILNGNVTSERLVVESTGAPVLASTRPLTRSPVGQWMLPRPVADLHSDAGQPDGLAPTRVAYALRQAFADTRPANILILSIGTPAGATTFARTIAEELHDMGEAVLFAHANKANSIRQQAQDKPFAKSARATRLDAIIAKTDGWRETGGADPGPATSAANGLAKHLHVEQIDRSRKYASSGALVSDNEDFLLVDVGDPDTSPMLPVLLRHCDGIVLLSALGGTRIADVERTIAYLEPWHDRIVGNVVFDAA